MKASVLTIRLDHALQRQLAALAKRLGRSRSDIAREALRRQLALLQFEEARRSLMPIAEARRHLTDHQFVLRENGAKHVGTQAARGKGCDEDIGVEADPHETERNTSSSVRYPRASAKGMRERRASSN